ncbi:MAG: TRAP transporter fused permease subunit [Desulfobacterales bacterium]|nr:TRAP transporter fused permease subunit [Desulfobacterales bacterium]
MSSALYGTVSGSTVANVYATGSFTIPLMKRSGYTAKQSAAIETVAGIGGQIMPPIMGAGSFIMSEITGVPYFTIIKVAVIPAILYYLGVFCMVHFIALQARDSADRSGGAARRCAASCATAYFFLPFLTVVGLLAYGYSPAKAAFHTIWITLLLSFLDRKTWLTPSKLLDIFFGSLVNCALIAAVLAGSGMVVGVLTRTGVALAFGSILVSFSLNSLLLVLLLVFLVVSVLGTGIPTTASYIIAVTVGAYALSKFGVPPLAAHFFVFYYAVLADMTPPDAVTAFAAANIAGAEPMATGVEGFRLGIAGFLVPFAFVFQPELLLNGSPWQIAFTLAVTVFGVVCLSAGVIGHLFAPLKLVQRIASRRRGLLPGVRRGDLFDHRALRRARAPALGPTWKAGRPRRDRRAPARKPEEALPRGAQNGRCPSSSAPVSSAPPSRFTSPATGSSRCSSKRAIRPPAARGPATGSCSCSPRNPACT